MDTTTIEAALGSRNMERLADVNDWAVNMLRDWAREHYTPEEYDRLTVLLVEETARIDSEKLDMEGYVFCTRMGSHFRLARCARRYVYTVIMTRRAIATLKA